MVGLTAQPVTKATGKRWYWHSQRACCALGHAAVAAAAAAAAAIGGNAG